MLCSRVFGGATRVAKSISFIFVFLLLVLMSQVGFSQTEDGATSRHSEFPLVDGRYKCKGRCNSDNCAFVIQSRDRLKFVNEKGDVSAGAFLAADQVVAKDWEGGLRGGLVGGDIKWRNGTVWTPAENCPVPRLPVDGKVPPKREWLKDATKEDWEIARYEDCSCRSITLGYIKARMYNETTKRYNTTVLFDRWNASSRNALANLKLPVLNWHSGAVFPPSGRPDRLCFYFTFPSRLAYMRRRHKPHPCNVHVQIKYPREISGRSNGFGRQDRKLYSVEGTGGTSSGTIFGWGPPGNSAGTDGRSIVTNFICISPVVQYWSIGGKGKTGSVVWSIRRSSSLFGGTMSRECRKINFTMK